MADQGAGDDKNAIALRRKVDFVGKSNKKSKVSVFWAFQSRRGSCFRHEVKMTYSSMSGKRRIWFNGKIIHDSRNFSKKSHVPHRYKWEGGGYSLECLSLKNSTNYKINLIVDGTPFIKLARRSQNISLEDIFQKRRMCRVDGSWGENTAIAIGCTSEHLGKRLPGSKRKIQYHFVFVDTPEKEHVVEIMYSILSGKRQLSVDGQQVHKSQKLQMTLQFKHAFKSIGHMFEMLVQEKSDMILTRLCIDGMDYRRLPLVSREQLAVALEKRAKRKLRAGSVDVIDEGDLAADDSEVEEGEDDDEDDEEEEAAADDNAGGISSDDAVELSGALSAPAAAAAEYAESAPSDGDFLADLFAPTAAPAPGSQAAAASFDPFAMPAPAPAPAQPLPAPAAAFDPFAAMAAPAPAPQNQSADLSDLFSNVGVSQQQQQQQQRRPLQRYQAAPPEPPAQQSPFDPFGNAGMTAPTQQSAPPVADPFAGF